MKRRFWLPLLIVAAVGVILGNIASWLELNLVDTSRFVSTTTAVLNQENVRQALADRFVERLLAERPVIQVAAGDAIESIVAGALGGERFQDLLASIATQLHAMLTTGDRPTVTIESRLLQLIVVAAARIIAPEQASQLQVEDGTLEIELFAQRDIPNLEPYIDLLRWAGLIAGIITLGLMALVIARSDDRRVAVGRCGVAVVAAALVFIVIVPVVRVWMVSRVENAAQETIVREFITAFTGRLVLQTGFLLLVGCLMMVYGYGVFARISSRRAETTTIRPAELS